MRQLNTSADTNTQAMTEVALGLSMAFFSLLILALLSITAGSEIKNTAENVEHFANTQVSKNDALTSILEQSRLSLSEKSPQDGEQNNSDSASVITFVFYYKGAYYNANLQPQEILNVSAEKPTVVAVVPDLSFAEVMQVHKDFRDKEIQITAMDENWQRAFAERVDPSITKQI